MGDQEQKESKDQEQKSSKGDDVKSSFSGKTMADFLDGLVTDPKRWLGLIGFLACLSVMVMLLGFAFTKLFGVSAKEVQLGQATSVIFESVERGTRNRELLVLVHPQGWQKTDIRVESGDHLSFNAEGSVNIDLAGIIANVQHRLQLEDEIAKKNNIIRTPTEKRVPEDFFSPEQRQSLQLDRAWIDPYGFKNESYVNWPGRRDRRVLPENNPGGLIAAIKTGSEDFPTRPETFFVGRTRKRDATTGGSLWFTVNDIQYNDPANRNLFFNDNVGLFWVKVKISPK